MLTAKALERLHFDFPPEEVERFASDELRTEVRGFVRNCLNWQWRLGTHSRDEPPPRDWIDEHLWLDRYFPDLEDIPPRPFTSVGTDSVWGNERTVSTIWIDYAGREVAPPKEHRELPHDRPWGLEVTNSVEKGRKWSLVERFKQLRSGDPSRRSGCAGWLAYLWNH